MGHRHFFSTSQIFETDDYQSWNNEEQPCLHLARAGNAENSFVYPVENMPTDVTHLTSNGNPSLESNGYVPSNQYAELPHFQQGSNDPSLHSSASSNFSLLLENHGQNGSSSGYDGQIFHGVHSGFQDIARANGRGHNKRKCHAVPATFERGSTSRYCDAESSSDSDLPMPSESWLDKPIVDFQMPWECPVLTPSGGGNILLNSAEVSTRNVRTRAALDQETNLARTQLLSNPPHHSSYCNRQTIDYSSSVDHLAQSSNISVGEWNHNLMAPAAGMTVVASDSSVFSHDMNNITIGSSNPTGSSDTGGYCHSPISTRHLAPQYRQGTSSQPLREVQSSNIRRPVPFSRASSNLRLGHVATSSEGLQAVRESNLSRHLRPCSSIGWQSCERNGRARLPNDRNRLLTNEAGVRTPLAYQGIVFVDRSTWYGSRSMFDHHRNMRLDIDNMSYEELLALGERIGNVSTGLSEDLVSKCLMESIYCSSDETQEEGKCVICLEEYKNMDDIGMLRGCRHDFHVGCIGRWLVVKNSCPICKASALDDRMKHK